MMKPDESENKGDGANHEIKTHRHYTIVEMMTEFD